MISSHTNLLSSKSFSVFPSMTQWKGVVKRHWVGERLLLSDHSTSPALHLSLNIGWICNNSALSRYPVPTSAHCVERRALKVCVGRTTNRPSVIWTLCVPNVPRICIFSVHKSLIFEIFHARNNDLCLRLWHHLFVAWPCEITQSLIYWHCIGAPNNLVSSYVSIYANGGNRLFIATNHFVILSSAESS